MTRRITHVALGEHYCVVEHGALIQPLQKARNLTVGVSVLGAESIPRRGLARVVVFLGGIAMSHVEMDVCR